MSRTTEEGMSKTKLVVKVSAQFVWVEPPKHVAEEAMRKQLNIAATEAANTLNPATQLLVLEILNAQSALNA